MWLLIAAALDPGIAAIAVNRTPYSLLAALDHPLTRNFHSSVIPGFALRWDLADLVSAERVSWTDPVDWLGHVVHASGKDKYTASPE